MKTRPFAALLAACCMQAGAIDLAAGGGMFRLPLASMRDVRFQSTVHQQYDFSCGSAAVATLLSYHYGYPVSEQQVFQEMFARGDQNQIRRAGFSLLDMKRYLDARGFLADGFEQPLAKLLEAGLPAIVLVSENGYHHFVVIKGMAGGRVLLGDPASGTHALALGAFERIWLNRLLFVVHNRPAQARFNTVADWRAAPRAQLGEAIARDGLGNVTLPMHSNGDK
ncbi:MAG: C39 family peptidase [Pseudomonadota bacterium]